MEKPAVLIERNQLCLLKILRQCVIADHMCASSYYCSRFNDKRSAELIRNDIRLNVVIDNLNATEKRI